jgi:chromosome segregation ATPase
MTNDLNETHHKNSTMPFAILSGALVLTLAGTAFLWVRSNRLSDDIAKIKDGTSVQIAQLNAASEADRAQYRQRLEALTASLDTANSTAETALKRARAEAAKQAKEFAARLDQQQQQIGGEITSLKDADAQAASKISEVATNVDGVKTDVTGVKTDVDGVKQEVANAKTSIEQHASELKRMVGDMGVMSGLIATNSKDLNALRELGERNYYEFSLTKAQKSKKVGDMIIAFKKADPKRNRFTVEVTANDKRVEKRDRTINEPVQIFLAGNRQPSEIVVNQVNKDEIVGYVAVPKVMVSQR